MSTCVYESEYDHELDREAVLKALNAAIDQIEAGSERVRVSVYGISLWVDFADKEIYVMA